MQASQIDNNGFFMFLVPRQPSPLEEGVWLLPAGAVEQLPPSEALTDGERWKYDAGEFVKNVTPMPEDVPEGSQYIWNGVEWVLTEIV